MILNWVRTLPLCAALTVGQMSPVMSEEPLSAIPWLSETLATPARPTRRITPQETQPEPAISPEIEVSVLPALAREGVGLLPSATTGLPINLWNGLSELRVRGLISDIPVLGVPATRDLFARVLLARVLAPVGSGKGDSLLVARIDRLLEMGRLDAADALIKAAGPVTPEIFRRAFDIGLLTGTQDQVCETLLAEPGISPSRQAMVFCLSLSGQWKAANAMLEDATALGEISDENHGLLARFLDPDLFEDETPLRPTGQISAMEYLIREAISLPQPKTTSLPLAFRHLDLNGHAGLKRRILAAETLVAAGAQPSNVLFAAYRAGAPAASGGVWDRVAAIQNVDAAPKGQEWNVAMAEAYRALAPHGLVPALAEEYAGELGDDDPGTETATPAGPQLSILQTLTGKLPNTHNKSWPIPVQQAHALTQNQIPPSTSARNQGIAAGLNGTFPQTAFADQLSELTRADKTGALILAALKLLGSASALDSDDLQAALAALVKADLTQDALKIAVETLVLEHGL